jgi:hypothetical protein
VQASCLSAILHVWLLSNNFAIPSHGQEKVGAVHRPMSYHMAKPTVRAQGPWPAAFLLDSHAFRTNANPRLVLT